jgi:Ca2+-transporting ATPase
MSRLDDEPLDRQATEEAITSFARKSLRMVVIVYKDFGTLPDLESLRDLTVLGVVGIQDSVRPGVPAAI